MSSTSEACAEMKEKSPQPISGTSLRMRMIAPSSSVPVRIATLSCDIDMLEAVGTGADNRHDGLVARGGACIGLGRPLHRRASAVACREVRSSPIPISSPSDHRGAWQGRSSNCQRVATVGDLPNMGARRRRMRRWYKLHFGVRSKRREMGVTPRLRRPRSSSS